MAMIDEIKKEIFCSNEISAIRLSQELKKQKSTKSSKAYNKGLRDALNIFNKHIASEKYEEATK